MSDVMPKDPGTGTPPPFQVIRGDLEPEELAALTAVLLALTPEAEEEPAAAAPRASTRSWVRRAVLRVGLRPGPGAWRRSGWR